MFIVWDDVGYGTMDCFGGPVRTPTMNRIAERGLRYSNFHTTALCSPTRASILTGRNAPSNGMATIAEFSSGFPGISTRIPFENGFISEVLLEHGYNTYCVGKWHLTPGEETGMAAWKKRWPLGRGFERFYGFLGGESSCWYPDLIHDNHPTDPPGRPEDGYHIAKDLSGINPHGEPGTTGPDGQPWPALDTVRPWDSLSPDEQRLFARMAEVFAGYVEYTDDQVGRVIDFLESSGELDNTIIVVVSDNGGSGEGGPDGTFNEWRFFNGMPTPTELTLEHLDELGGPKSYNHYSTGWAWAFDTPFPYWKRWAGFEGGIADMCLVSWPARIAPDATPRPQYIHAVDIVPTIYELIGVTPPETLNGYAQSPIEGESFAATFTDPSAPGKHTQFYAMLGQRAVYDDGWLACTVHPPLSGWGKFEHDVWELYHVAVDRSQSENLADKEPERLERMKTRWFELAEQYNGLPLDDRTALEQALAERPSGSPARERYVYYPDCAAVPEQSAVTISGRPYTIAAGVQDRKLTYAFNWVGTHLQTVTADRPLEPGAHVLTAEFVAEGRSEDPLMPGARRSLTLYVDGDDVAHAAIVTQPGMFCVVGDGLCVGRDDASAVTPGLHRALPVHRRLDRQGRRGRLRAAVRRPRGPGPRLVPARLSSRPDPARTCRGEVT